MEWIKQLKYLKEWTEKSSSSFDSSIPFVRLTKKHWDDLCEAIDTVNEGAIDAEARIDSLEKELKSKPRIKYARR